MFDASKLVHRIAKVSDVDFQGRMQRMLAARFAYTNDGVTEQLKLFFRDPLGPLGGAINCAPKKVVSSNVQQAADYLKRTAMMKMML